jgi:hypothetical protein
MLKETRADTRRLGQRPVPSLNRTMEALRMMRGRDRRLDAADTPLGRELRSVVSLGASKR